MRIAVVAEKPAVARDIARVLGAVSSNKGFLAGNGYIITWAVGHLVTLAEPHEMNPQWKAWRKETLPIIPDNWKLKVLPKTRSQFNTIKQIINSRDVSHVVCATDAGREGELIFHYIYTMSGCRKPVYRLWISSLTPDAIRSGFAALKPGKQFHTLLLSAIGRSRADWLVGMNLSRAYSLNYNTVLSVGRVQTPTLAILAERETAIKNFVPEKYREVHATFSPTTSPGNTSAYTGVWFRSRENGTPVCEKKEEDTLRSAKRLPMDSEEADSIAQRVRNSQAARIESISAKQRRIPPPLLYDLTELQRHANRLYGFSARKTLETAQVLYERKKLISYPRTDSRHLSSDVARTIPRIVHAISEPYRKHLPFQNTIPPLSRRYVNDQKVTDHHAIIPTTQDPKRKSLTKDEWKVYDLICRRLLMAWSAPNVTKITTIITAVYSHFDNHPVTDRFHSTGTVVEQIGWKALDIQPAYRKSDAPVLPTGLQKDQPQKVLNVEIKEKETKPPKRYTDATLLTAMETAGKALDDKELSDAMKERGLGTPATRAAILETLLKRRYIARKGKVFEVTPRGMQLIEVVHPKVKSPEMTGDWEFGLRRIERGNASFNQFMSGIEAYVREAVAEALSNRSSDAFSASAFIDPPSNLDNFSAQKILLQIFQILENTGAMTTGRLFKAVVQHEKTTRNIFENILKQAAQSAWISLTQHSFEKSGEIIHYRKAGLTRSGREKYTLLRKQIKSTPVPGKKSVKQHRKQNREPAPVIRMTGVHAEVQRQLRVWRKRISEQQGIPLVRILKNTVLDEIAAELPQTMQALRGVKGVGPVFIGRFGKDIIELVRRIVNKPGI